MLSPYYQFGEVAKDACSISSCWLWRNAQLILASPHTVLNFAISSLLIPMSILPENLFPCFSGSRVSCKMRYWADQNLYEVDEFLHALGSPTPVK